MQHIPSDPALEVQLNFKLVAYIGWLNALTAGGITREDALNHMPDGWRFKHQEHITLWQQQVEEDAQEQQEQLECEKAEKEAKEQEEQCEAEKKKSKINDFDEGAIVADIIILYLSQYATQKIKNMEYIELWYFSPDRCRKVAITSRSTSDTDDTYSFAKVNGMVALKMIASFKASNKVLQDHNLSWWQFDLAKTSFLIHIEKGGWPEKHQQLLALFFTLITNHEHCMCSCGEKTLLHYTGFMRHKWHDWLAHNQGFNIGLFNNALYNSILDNVWETKCDESLKWYALHHLSLNYSGSNKI